VSVATAARGQFASAYLHEPHGDPYRGENGLGAGFGSSAAVFTLDARDVVPGVYEVVAVGSPVQPLSAGFRVEQSPVILRANRRMDGAHFEIENRSDLGVTVDPLLVLVGGEREAAMTGDGGEVSRLPLRIPDWASSITIDVSMNRAQWSRFTDLGLTLFDSLGHQIAKAPLQYAFGRLTSDLPSHHGEMLTQLALFPGLADPGSSERWSLDLSVRLYADSTGIVETPAPPVTIAPGTSATVTIVPPLQPFHLNDGLDPLAVLVARVAGRAWTREIRLPLPGVAPSP
jgi:hypothetical protein